MHCVSNAGITFKGQLQLVAFCLFEFAVGVFWPSMMKMRSQHVPEEMRATVINLFRIPLNLFVCVVLYNVSPLIRFPKLNHPMQTCTDTRQARQKSTHVGCCLDVCCST